MTRTIVGSVWVVTWAVTLALLLGGCEAPPESTVESPPKPGQAEAVALALAAYGLPADTPVPIAWLDGWECLNDHPEAPRAVECIVGMRDSRSGQVWIAWPAGRTHVRDVSGTLAHEVAHIVDSFDDRHGCASTEESEWKQHHRCGDFWGVGGVVDAVTVAIWGIP